MYSELYGLVGKSSKKIYTVSHLTPEESNKLVVILGYGRSPPVPSRYDNSILESCQLMRTRGSIQAAVRGMHRSIALSMSSLRYGGGLQVPSELAVLTPMNRHFKLPANEYRARVAELKRKVESVLRTPCVESLSEGPREDAGVSESDKVMLSRLGIFSDDTLLVEEKTEGGCKQGDDGEDQYLTRKMNEVGAYLFRDLMAPLLAESSGELVHSISAYNSTSPWETLKQQVFDLLAELKLMVPEVHVIVEQVRSLFLCMGVSQIGLLFDDLTREYVGDAPAVPEWNLDGGRAAVKQCLLTSVNQIEEQLIQEWDRVLSCMQDCANTNNVVQLSIFIPVVANLCRESLRFSALVTMALPMCLSFDRDVAERIINRVGHALELLRNLSVVAQRTQEEIEKDKGPKKTDFKKSINVLFSDATLAALSCAASTGKLQPRDCYSFLNSAVYAQTALNKSASVLLSETCMPLLQQCRNGLANNTIPEDLVGSAPTDVVFHTLSESTQRLIVLLGESRGNLSYVQALYGEVEQLIRSQLLAEGLGNFREALIYAYLAALGRCGSRYKMSIVNSEAKALSIDYQSPQLFLAGLKSNLDEDKLLLKFSVEAYEFYARTSAENQWSSLLVQHGLFEVATRTIGNSWKAQVLYQQLISNVAKGYIQRVADTVRQRRRHSPLVLNDGTPVTTRTNQMRGVAGSESSAEFDANARTHLHSLQRKLPGSRTPFNYKALFNVLGQRIEWHVSPVLFGGFIGSFWDPFVAFSALQTSYIYRVRPSLSTLHKLMIRLLLDHCFVNNHTCLLTTPRTTVSERTERHIIFHSLAAQERALQRLAASSQLARSSFNSQARDEIPEIKPEEEVLHEAVGHMEKYLSGRDITASDLLFSVPVLGCEDPSSLSSAATPNGITVGLMLLQATKNLLSDAERVLRNSAVSTMPITLEEEEKSDNTRSTPQSLIVLLLRSALLRYAPAGAEQSMLLFGVPITSQLLDVTRQLVRECVETCLIIIARYYPPIRTAVGGDLAIENSTKAAQHICRLGTTPVTPLMAGVMLELCEFTKTFSQAPNPEERLLFSAATQIAKGAAIITSTKAFINDYGKQGSASHLFTELMLYQYLNDISDIWQEVCFSLACKNTRLTGNVFSTEDCCTSASNYSLNIVNVA